MRPSSIKSGSQSTTAYLASSLLILSQLQGAVALPAPTPQFLGSLLTGLFTGGTGDSEVGSSIGSGRGSGPDDRPPANNVPQGNNLGTSSSASAVASPTAVFSSLSALPPASTPVAVDPQPAPPTQPLDINPPGVSLVPTSKPIKPAGGRVVKMEGLQKSGLACDKPRIRKEWRKLTNVEKSAYIKAVECLHHNRPQFQQYYPGARTRYDDFTAMHINATGDVVGPHNTGYFLPYHRYSVWLYENALKGECGYTGAQPYWDWTLDTAEKGGSFATSPIFDPVTGFGSMSAKRVPNPQAKKAPWDQADCLDNGPFASYQLNIGPGDNVQYNPRCLRRDFRGDLGERSVAQSIVMGPLMATPSYEHFSEMDFAPLGNKDRGGPHTTGHNGVGGVMANLYSSPNDPLFWVHHASVDRIWYLWQGRNNTRLNDVRRSTIEFHYLGQPIPQGRAPGVTQLNSAIFQVGMHAPIIPIRQVVDTINEDGEGVLCYRYDA